PAEQRYSQFGTIGLQKLLILCHGEVRQHLATLLRKATPPPLRLLAHLARDAERGKSRPSLAATLDQYLGAYSSLVGGVKGAVWSGPLRLLFQLLLRFPALTLWLM